MDKLNEFITNVENAILTPIVTLLALFAFAFFVWGVVVFIANAGDEEKRRTGQQHMFWGIIGLIIIFGANAIIRVLANTVGADAPL